MAGLCGAVGDVDHAATAVVDELCVTGLEHCVNYCEADVHVHGVFHTETDQPAETTDGDVLVWVWGNVTGHEDVDGYDARAATDANDLGEGNDAGYVAALYDRLGREAFAGLNGDYTGVVYDRAARTVSLFVDRLAARELFYARAAGTDTVVFASLVGAVTCYPDVTAAFDPDLLAEYFTYGHVFGTDVPLRGIEAVDPGSVVTVDLDAGTVEQSQHWRPRHRPVDRPLGVVVDEFVDHARSAIAEHTRPGVSYGLLLSGGSDSRFLLAAMPPDRDVTAYHMCDWMNTEARTAERVAETAGVDLEFLVRDAEYEQRLLDTAPRTVNFTGEFSQAHAGGFVDRLRDEVDVVMTSHMSGILAKPLSVPLRSIPLSLRSDADLTLPLMADVSSVEELVQWRLKDQPAYLQSASRLRDALSTHCRMENGVIHDHGVKYDSLRSLFVASSYVPRHADDLFAPHLMHSMPYRDPLVDNRLVDLRHRTPMRYIVRHHVVNRAMEQIAPDLAAIPHGTDRVPPASEFPYNWLVQMGYAALRRLFDPERPPEPHMRRGPWPDHAEIIRTQNFALNRLVDHRDRIERLPFLDWDGVLGCYRDHLNGADNTTALYTLLTVLEMPVTRRVLDASSDDSSEANRPDLDPDRTRSSPSEH
jgi:asparagine synthase (glutamine-hydrolysing)